MTSNEIIPRRQTAHRFTWQTLVEFDLSGEPGSECLAVDRVVEAVQRLNWPAAHLEQLSLALAQAVRKAMECDRRCDLEGALFIRVLVPNDDPATREADPANDQSTQLQASEPEARQAGQPASRGWSFFLIEKATSDCGDGGRHLLELFLYPEGGKHDPHGC